MRRTKEWWASLKGWERQWLVFAEREEKSFSFPDPYLPDGCRGCRICGEPGSCGCSDEVSRIIDKASEAVDERNRLVDLMSEIQAKGAVNERA